MNLDELRSVQSKERQKDSLQHLRDSFYADVGDYIANLKNERERAAARAEDPFSSPDVSHLTDEIETAEEVVEAVYERRMGKIVKRASLAAAGMPADEEGLTAEEQELFSELVDRIEANKAHVHDVLSGNEPSSGSSGAHGSPNDASEQPVEAVSHEEHQPAQGSDEVPPPPPDRPPEAENADVPRTSSETVDAADLMGGSPTDDDTRPASAPLDSDSRAAEDLETDRSGVGHSEPSRMGPPTDREDPAADTERSRTSTTDLGDTRAEKPSVGGNPPNSVGGDAESKADRTDSTADNRSSTDRTTVRITEDIGEIFGVDDREYELSAEDVVTLPTANAEPLLEQDAAQRID